MASRRAALPRAFFRWPDWLPCWSWRPSSPFSVLEAWFKSSGSALAGLLVCLHCWPASSRYSTEFLAVAWPLCLRRVTVFWPLSSERWPCRPCGCKFTCRCFTLLVFSWLCLLLALVCAARRCLSCGLASGGGRTGMGWDPPAASPWRSLAVALLCGAIVISWPFPAVTFKPLGWVSGGSLAGCRVPLPSPFLIRLYPRVAKRSRVWLDDRCSIFVFRVPLFCKRKWLVRCSCS